MAEEIARLKEEALTMKQQNLRSEVLSMMLELARWPLSVFPSDNITSLISSNCSDFPDTMSPGARTSRVFALENMLATSSSTLVSMASQLSEAEERERAFSGRGRWNQVRSLAEAKNIMNFLFNLAAASR